MNVTKKKTVLDAILEQGYFSSHKEAMPWAMAGKIYVGQTRVKSLWEKVNNDDLVSIKGYSMPYVSKGGLKLEGAIKDFGISICERVCIDAGACTGGFTDCLLKHQAQLVYAIEVGFGQLHGSLRQNERVINFERTNISDEKLFELSPIPTLGSVDLSYLSLRKAIPVFKNIMRGKGELICLVKPLFEIDDTHIRRTGEIDERQYADVLRLLIQDINMQKDTVVVNVTHSHVTGNNGTYEFFIHVLFQEAMTFKLDSSIEHAVNSVLSLEKFKKI